VAAAQRVHIHYESLRWKPASAVERDVDPWGLAFRGRAWRLVGWCHASRDQRVFLVDRIAAVETNPQKPHTPDFEPPEGFDVAERGGPLQQALAVAHHPPQEVTLRFAAGSEAIAERIFDAPDGKLASPTWTGSCRKSSRWATGS